MRGVIADTKLILDETCDAPTSPNCAPKAEGLSSSGEQMHQLCALPLAQAWLGSRSRMVTQCFYSMQGGTFEPLANRTLADTQGLGDKGLLPPLLVQLPGLAAATFAPAKGSVTLVTL